jgi:hypothetical protein
MATQRQHTIPVVVKFSFINNAKEWFWFKTLHVKPTGNLQDEIADYLSRKKLPFELTPEDINYKRTNSAF